MDNVGELHDTVCDLITIAALPAALDELRLLEEKYAVALAERAKAQEALLAASTAAEEAMLMIDSFEAALSRTYSFLPCGAHSHPTDIDARRQNLKGRFTRAKEALYAIGGVSPGAGGAAP